MSDLKLVAAEDYGRQFVPAAYLPAGQDEYYLRNQQVGRPAGSWRHLRAEEIETLVKNGNTADNWDTILVSDPFTPQLISNNKFFGLIRIGKLQNVVMEHHELQLPVGITNSRIISCDLGDNVAVHNVRYLAHYILGDCVMLLNIDEMNTTNHAKFGNGIIKDGEAEEVRIWIDLVNEVGTRGVMPFDGMTTADAYLWAKYRDDTALQDRLKCITQSQFDARRGFYGTVGDVGVIKNCQIIKDVKIGPACYIKGANKLKNLTINSSREEPTQIGEGVELVNGIIGLGCRIFYGCKAVRFVMGNNTHLKYGARLIHSYLGDNSTVSCCEILNNLIFPAHEQHHNNSFLCASLVLGQSNIAAGATIGSNHNSRSNDGEILAGRGFWPGLCTTLKHCCRFASFTLLAKADYPSELDVPLPFSLLNNDVARDQLLIMPAYWWMYNMYALARNSWKFQARDKRKAATQHIEFDSLAPDTVEEIIRAIRLLEIWTAKSQIRAKNQSAEGHSDESLARLGRELLMASPEQTARLEVLGEKIENSRRKVVILKPRAAYHAYRQMLHHYAMKNLLAYLQADPRANRATMEKALAGPAPRQWVNLGGQLVSTDQLAALLEDIKSGTLAAWPDIHYAYDALWQQYPLLKQRHALAVLHDLMGTQKLSADDWQACLDEAVRLQEYVRDHVFVSRQKDFQDDFRKITFRNAAEMEAVVGTAEDNSFVKQVRAETEQFKQLIAAVRQRG